MCGFAGFKLTRNTLDVTPTDLLKSMGDSILHRGPDDEGIWFDEQTGLGFSHRRLSIQDLSSSGAQPMISASGRYVIVYNGEIYNFIDIRREFIKQGHVFKGHSDTEVMLLCFEKWGLQIALAKFEGMFAFALYDKEDKLLYLVRDRMGEKPLYYGWQKNNTLMFASELKALKVHPDFDDTINRDAIGLLLKHNYIPAPYSIYKTVSKLEPGCLLTIDIAQNKKKYTVEKYWDVSDFYKHEQLNKTHGEAVEELERLLMKSVKQQMVSDVPLGAFLSGGVDSSTIVALMQHQSDRKIKTFSIGFEDEAFNEAKFAKNVASHIGTDHTELYLSASDSLNVVPLLSEIYDEPFADSSQIPTYLVSKLAKSQVSVSLSGDGGDELFCGYERYFATVNAWSLLKNEPAILRLLKNTGMTALPDNILSTIIKQLFPTQRKYSLRHLNEKLSRFRDIYPSSSLQDYYAKLISYQLNTPSIVIDSNNVAVNLNSYNVENISISEHEQLSFLDTISYLPDDILTKIDRAAMANSLETRVPLLNHKVVEFAATLPVEMKVQNNAGKKILRDVLYKYVPRNLIERPKRGFAVPLDSWLRSELKDWANNLLQPSRIIDEGYFNEKYTTALWQEHSAGTCDHSFKLWGILSFQSWLEHNKAEMKKH